MEDSLLKIVLNFVDLKYLKITLQLQNKFTEYLKEEHLTHSVLECFDMINISPY